MDNFNDYNKTQNVAQLFSKAHYSPQNVNLALYSRNKTHL
jgi:hypothetical protein